MTMKTAKQHEEKDKGQHELGSKYEIMRKIKIVTFKMVAYYE